MKILILGASSYIGSAVYDYLRPLYTVSGTYFSKQIFPDLFCLNLLDSEMVKAVIHEYLPDVIIHVAASSRAKDCELHPENAKQLNEEAVKVVVAAANEVKAKMIFFSSVYAGDESIYGQTKAVAEGYVQQTKAGYCILRPALVLGRSPHMEEEKFFTKLQKNLRNGEGGQFDMHYRMRVTWIRQLQEIIVQVIEGALWNVVLPVSSPEFVTRYEIARDILLPFNVTAEAIDKGYTRPVFEEDLHILHMLKLPEYSYTQVIEELRNEIV